MNDRMNDSERVAIMFCDALHEMQSIKRSISARKRVTPIEEVANELSQMLIHSGDDVIFLKIAALLKRNLLSQAKTKSRTLVAETKTL